MGHYTEKLETLYNEMVAIIIENIQEKGVESKHIEGIKVMIVDNVRSFELVKGLWLDEVSEEGIIDNQGYEYNFDRISLEELADLADYLDNFEVQL
jgi:hypothetical protein